MKFLIDSDILEKEGLSILEFSILLYYIAGGRGTLNEDICTTLWEKRMLTKDIEGYIIEPTIAEKVQSWTSYSACTDKGKDRIPKLAKGLQALFPEGKKAGTNYYWRDSCKVIEKRIALFFKKYGENYTDEQILRAAETYTKSFNSNYQYMQLLKYFIYKRGEAGEENSQLLSYIENADSETKDSDWTAKLV